MRNIRRMPSIKSLLLLIFLIVSPSALFSQSAPEAKTIRSSESIDEVRQNSTQNLNDKTEAAVDEVKKKEQLSALYKSVLLKEENGKFAFSVISNQQITDLLKSSISVSEFIQKMTEQKIEPEIIKEFKKTFYENNY